MGVINVLEKWMEPITNPLGEFRSNMQTLVQIHTDSLKTFKDLSSSLTEAGPDETLTGELGEEFWTSVQDFLSAENDLFGGATSISEGATLTEALTEGEQACQACLTTLENAALQATTEAEAQGALDGLTEAVDELDISTLGAFPPLDVVAIILTIISAAAIVGTIVSLAWAVYNAVQGWNKAMNNAADKKRKNLPKQPEPKKPIVLPPPKIYLTPDQEKAVNDIMSRLGKAGITGIDRKYIEALVAAGYDPTSILDAILGWHRAGWSDSRIEFALEDAYFNTVYTIPYGIKSFSELQKFISTLQTGLKDAGYPCASASIGGSSVTGKSFKTQEPFDQGRQSDYDLAIGDPELLAKAKRLGIGMRGDGVRSDPLNRDQLRRLGLYDLYDKLSKLAGRKVSIMLYDSTVITASRQPVINFLQKSC